MMTEHTSPRHNSSEESRPMHTYRAPFKPLSPAIRRAAWDLFTLLGLVAVTGYFIERSGIRDSGLARGMVLGEHSGPVRSIEFVRGTSNLVSLDTTGESWLWDTTARRVRSSMGGPGSPVSSQALDPPGRSLATGGRDGTIALWDLATGKRQALLATARGPVRAWPSLAMAR